jgi:hypothetical protein
MFNKFRAGSAFSRKRPAAAPAAPTQQRAVAAPATNSMFNKFRAGSAFSRKRPAAAPAAPTQQRAVAAPAQGLKLTPAQVAAPTTPQPRMTNDIVSQNDAKGNAMMKQASRAADERFLEKQAQKAKATPAPAVQVPTPPPFRKGGAVKKTGYAKGGAVMCGASMPPAQKRKK